jgi:hypothetical protein
MCATDIPQLKQRNCLCMQKFADLDCTPVAWVGNVTHQDAVTMLGHTKQQMDQALLQSDDSMSTSVTITILWLSISTAKHQPGC